MSLRCACALAAFASSILLAACGGYGDDGTAPRTPAFTLSATPATLEVQAGGATNSIAAADVVNEGEVNSAATVFGSGTINVSITRSGGFEGAVTVAVEGLPANVTAASLTIPAGSTSGSIIVTAAAGATVGSASLTLRGTGTGVAAQTASLQLTVTAPPGSIALTTSPATLSVQPGTSASTTLTIARTNFTGTVNLTSPGAPAGVSVTFNPSSTTTTTSTVTVAVGASVTAGTYQLTLQGAGTGIANATLSLNLSVTPPGSGNATWTFCAQSGLPLWFAYQDFGGSWTQVVASNHVYNFNINARGVVAWVMQQGAQTNLQLYYGSAQDLATRGSAFCRGNGSVKTVNVTALGIGPTEHAYVTMGSAFGFVQQGSPNPFQVTNVPDGVLDLIGVRSGLTPNSIVIQRNRNDANGANVNVDFATGVAPVTRTATIANLGTEQATVTCNLFSKNNGLALLSEVPQVSTNPTRTWMGVPDASVIDGDFHTCSIYATPAGSPPSGPGRGINQSNKLAADRTYTLPDAITTPPTVTLQGTSPYVTLTSNWAIQSAQYNARWTLSFIPASGSVSVVFVTGTSGYFGSGPVQLAIPTFGAGFNPAHGLQPGVSVTWAFLAMGGNVVGAVEGALNTFANVQGAPFTP